MIESSHYESSGFFCGYRVEVKLQHHFNTIPPIALTEIRSLNFHKTKQISIVNAVI